MNFVIKSIIFPIFTPIFDLYWKKYRFYDEIQRRYGQIIDLMCKLNANTHAIVFLWSNSLNFGIKWRFNEEIHSKNANSGSLLKRTRIGFFEWISSINRHFMPIISELLHKTTMACVFAFNLHIKLIIWPYHLWISS